MKPIAFQSTEGRDFAAYEDLSTTVKVGSNGGGQPPAIAFSCKDHGADAGDIAHNQRDEVRTMDVAGALASEPGMKQQTYAQQGMQVRRLTPVECARLQGFPDTYLDIPYRGKPAADGPRYKALGNSMAVPVMRWIGERIAVVESVRQSQDSEAGTADESNGYGRRDYRPPKIEK